MRTASRTGRQALTEMRRLLGVLPRASDEPRGELAPAAGHRRARRADRAGPRSAGLPVHATMSAGAPAPLPAGLQLAVYRIVQEALTNTLKHAGAGRAGARCDCAVERGRRARSRSPTTARRARRRRPRAAGLRGMRERAAVYDGVVEAGPRDRRRLARRATRLAPPAVRRGGAGVSDRDRARRRPGAAAHGLPHGPRRPARPRRSWARRPTGARRVALAAELQPDVVLMDVRMPGHGRGRGDAARSSRAAAAPRVHHPHHLRPRRVRLRRAARRRQRLPAQGRPARRPARRRSARSPAATRSSRRARPGGCSTTVRRTAARRPRAAPRRPRLDAAHRRASARSRRRRPRAVQRRDRRPAACCPRRRSRPTSAGSSPSSALRDRVQIVVFAYERGLVAPAP